MALSWRPCLPLATFLHVRPSAIRVIAAVIARGDRLLVCQRPAHKRHGGLWEFPGGKVEPGESDLDAARRELREELGVEVTAVEEEQLAVADPGSPFVIVFLPVDIAGEPACHEHVALRWAAAGELVGLPLAPSDRRYVEFRLRARDASPDDGRAAGAGATAEQGG
jgi:mutator protein MutT